VEGPAGRDAEGERRLPAAPAPEDAERVLAADEGVVDIADEELARGLERRLGRQQRPQQGVVARRVPVPVVGRRRPGAARDAACVEGGLGQDAQAGRGDGLRVAGIDEEPVAAGLDDVVRPAAVGGDQRQARRRSFEQRQAEGLVQRRVDDPPRARAWA
jgi:hypothetical protein